MKTGKNFVEYISMIRWCPKKVVLIVHGNAKIADLSVANVDIHILLKVFSILLVRISEKDKRKSILNHLLGK